MGCQRLIILLILMTTCGVTGAAGAQDTAVKPLPSPPSSQDGPTGLEGALNQAGGTYIDHPLLAHLLEQSHTLGLSVKQVKSLRALRSVFQKQALEKGTGRQLAEIELGELQEARPLDYATIEARSKRIEAMGTELRIEAIRAADAALKLLTPEQRDEVESSGALRWSLPAPGGALAPDSRSQIQAALKEQLQDRKVVEVEAAEAIVNRLLDWTKIVGILLGAPLAILALVLAVLGIKSYKEFTERLGKIREGIEARIEAGQQQLTEDLVERLEDRYKEVEAELARVNALGRQVKALGSKVARIEERIRFASSPALTKTLRTQLKKWLLSYSRYLEDIGFPVEKEAPEVYIDPKMDYHGWYEGANKRIVLSKAFASTPDAAFRLYTHHALECASAEELHVSEEVMTIEYGLVNYFPCSFKDDPDARNLDNKRTFAELRSAEPSNMYAARFDGGEVWGGAFWELRRLLGRAPADRLLFRTWSSLRRAEAAKDAPANFVRKLLAIQKGLADDPHIREIEEIFRRRGLEI